MDQLQFILEYIKAQYVIGLAVALFIFIPLERLFPFHPKQPIIRRGWWTDLCHFLFDRLVIGPGVTFMIGLGVIGLGWLLSWLAAHQLSQFGKALHTLQVTMRGLPAWIQVLLAVLIGDLGFYWSHRLLHRVPLLWRFHSIHHSSVELDWLAAPRLHPIEVIFQQTCISIPIFLLGFRPDLSYWLVGISYLDWFIHANLRLPLGPLRYLILTPDFHHWHHSTDPAVFNRNFAGRFPWLDWIFGTFYLPKEKVVPETYGITDPVPTDYLRQLLYPFGLLAAPRPVVVPASSQPEPPLTAELPAQSTET